MLCFFNPRRFPPAIFPSKMTFRNRVAVNNCIGRRVFTAHRELAMAMVRDGEAEYKDEKTIVLVQSVRMTEEMLRPRILKFKVPHADSSTGDAGRGNTVVPRRQTVHFRPSSDRTPAYDRDGRLIGHRIAA